MGTFFGRREWGRLRYAGSPRSNASVAAEVARRRVLISGRVQGVGYRAGMLQEALRLDVVGWVRNRSDCTVEALLVGEEEAVAALIGWARKGSPFAEVRHVQIELSEEGDFSTFTLADSVVV